LRSTNQVTRKSKLNTADTETQALIQIPDQKILRHGSSLQIAEHLIRSSQYFRRQSIRLRILKGRMRVRKESHSAVNHGEKDVNKIALRAPHVYELAGRLKTTITA
jgi:hypothetical protein